MAGSPEIVAIVNITEDSFSDGGRYLAPESAIAHAGGLVDAGADWIELGPASSNPDADLVPADEQIRRLEPVVVALRDTPTRLSVDATDPEVIGWALDARIGMVNDVRGFPDPSTHERLASSDAAVVVVHSLARRERATREAATPARVFESIDRFFDQRLDELVRAGVTEERLILDPGMGFFLSSDPMVSVRVLERIPRLRARYGRPVFVSVSRKSFLRALTGLSVGEVGAATLATELHAARLGVDYLRTHDVAALASGLAVDRILRSGSL